MDLPQRDLIAIGASMGGIEALSTLVTALPADLPAAVLVVQHTAAEAPGALPRILDARGPLPAVQAENGMAVRPGRIHVAPPDRHLLLADGVLRVVCGPRENRHRPAIDPLFRTAAVAGRSRVIGVILSGLLGDGASGLHAVQRCGGTTVVQADAAFPEMPQRALEAVDADYHVPLADLGPLLGRLAGTPALIPPPIPDDLALEATLTHRAMTDGDWLKLPSHPTIYTCPECGGTLNEIDDAAHRRYRCHTGHAFSDQALLNGQLQATETALWAALRTMEERANMLDELSQQGSSLEARYAARAKEVREHAATIRQLIA